MTILILIETMMSKRIIYLAILLGVALGINFPAAMAEKRSSGTSPQQREFQGLDEQVQSLKEDVLKINHELMLLEEKLVFPSNTQVAIFVSLEPSEKFSIDSAVLTMDNKKLYTHTYNFREVEALQSGGVQRLHTTNLSPGGHQLVITINGKNGSNRSYKSSASFSIKKEPGPKLVELKIGNTDSSKPSISINEWR